MLFMGEEFDASTPFLYFCDFAGDLAAAVTAGRREEFGRFARFARSGGSRRDSRSERVRDLRSARSCAGSELEREPHRRRRALYRWLLELRREAIVPRLAGMASGGRYAVDGNVVSVAWILGDGSYLGLAANLGPAESATIALPRGEILYASGAPARARGAAAVDAWSSRWSTRWRRGDRRAGAPAAAIVTEREDAVSAPPRRCQPRACRARPTACSCTAASPFAAGGARCCRTWRRLGISHLYVSPLLRARARQPARLRRRRPRRAQPGAGRRADFDRLVEHAACARHGPAGRHRAQPHGRASAATTPGGSTCSRTARRRPTPSYFDIDWAVARRRRWRGRCCCRSSATSTASCSSAASCAWASTPTRACVSRSTISSIACPSTRQSVRPAADARDAAIARRRRAPLAVQPWRPRCRICRHDDASSVAARERRRDALPARSCAWPSWLSESAALRQCIERAVELNGRVGQRAELRRPATRCSTRRRTVSRTGASPPTRSTTGASSTSTTSRRCAPEDEAVFDATHRLILDLAAERQGRRPAHRPSRRALRSGGVLRAAAGALRAAARRRAPGGRGGARSDRCRWWRRRSSRAHEHLPRRLGGARHHRLPLRRRGQRPRSSTPRARTRFERTWRAFTGEALDAERPRTRAGARSCGPRSPPS